MDEECRCFFCGEKCKGLEYTKNDGRGACVKAHAKCVLRENRFLNLELSPYRWKLS
jgi:hypothetical protein